MSLTIADVLLLDHVKALNVTALQGSTFTGVSTDSRTVREGELFIALRGETFDGGKFARRAFQSGASCAIVEENTDLAPLKSKPVIVVRSGVQALGALANRHRKKFDIPLIAVAGSNGKTTTKDMIASVLGKQ